MFLPTMSKARFSLVLAVFTLLLVSAFFFAGCTNMPLAAPAPTKAAAAATPTKAAVAPSTAMTQTSATTAPIVMVREDPTLGKILVDDKGMTLYVFDKDTMGKSTCAADCAKNWPPLTVKDENEKLTAGEGVMGKLGVIKRDDGAYEITFNGMPLYHYAKDTKAGQTAGQGVGDVWWVVGASGAKIAKKG